MTSKTLHPFSYLTFTLDASRQRSTPSCIYIYASLRKLLIVSVQSKSKKDAKGFDYPQHKASDMGQDFILSLQCNVPSNTGYYRVQPLEMIAEVLTKRVPQA